MDAIRQEAALLAPIVPTGTTNGDYNKFDDSNAFKAYLEIVARRAVGGKATAIELLSTLGTYAAKPYGLRISIDQHERDQVGDNAGGMVLLEQAKTRTLTVNCLTSHLAGVITRVKAAVSAEAGVGVWTNANVDPIAEIDDLIWAVFKASGIMPNNVFMDVAAWRMLKKHPKVKAYFPGIDVMRITPDAVAGLFLNPNAVLTVSNTATLYGGGLGNSAATKRGITAGSVLVYYNSATPTQYDPSFCKVFAPSAQLFTEVYTYREEPHLDWYENDWTADVQIVSSSLCKRIDVTGAND
jgi:hypothetical protein